MYSKRDCSAQTGSTYDCASAFLVLSEIYFIHRLNGQAP